VRERERFWTVRDITAAPAMVFSEKYLMSGAQGIDNYISIIQQVQQALESDESIIWLSHANIFSVGDSVGA